MTKTKQSSRIDDFSMTNDALAGIAKRLEFFIPEFKTSFPHKERLFFMLILSVLMTISLVPNYIDNSATFIQHFLFEFILILLTVSPALMILDVYRPSLMKKNILQVNIRVLLIFFCTSIVATAFTLMLSMYLGVVLYEEYFVFNLLSHTIVIGFFTQLCILYFISRFQELQALSNSFDLRLETQNEIEKARMSPHFLFNTLNGLISVVETDPKQAVQTLTNVATLFRASLSDTDEVGFDQEVDLCNIFFSVDQMRFHGKLNVIWELPDEDDMYDMTITSLTLQSVLEKVFYHVVEMTTETVNVHISVTWKNHLVTILVDVKLPKKTLLVHHHIIQHMKFDIQAQRLKSNFGKTSKIETYIDDNLNNKAFQVHISYPLHDPYISNDSSLQHSFKNL